MGVVYSALSGVWGGLGERFVKAGEVEEVMRGEEVQIQWIPACDHDLVAEMDEAEEFRKNIASRTLQIHRSNECPVVVHALSFFPILREVLANLDLKSVVQLSRSDPDLMRFIQYDWILCHVVPKTRIVFKTLYMYEGREYFAKHQLAPVFRRVTRDQRYPPFGRLVYEVDVNDAHPPTFRRGEFHPHGMALYLDDQHEPWRWALSTRGTPRHRIRRRGRVSPDPMELIREVFYKFNAIRFDAMGGIPGPVRVDVFYRQSNRKLPRVTFHAASIPYKFFLELLSSSGNSHILDTTNDEEMEASKTTGLRAQEMDDGARRAAIVNEPRVERTSEAQDDLDNIIDSLWSGLKQNPLQLDLFRTLRVTCQQKYPSTFGNPSLVWVMSIWFLSFLSQKLVEWGMGETNWSPLATEDDIMMVRPFTVKRRWYCVIPKPVPT
jgi:hypothetical protein